MPISRRRPKAKRTRPRTSTPLRPLRVLPDAQRSATMRAVRSSDTRPELIVRGILRTLRYRPVFNDGDIPGSPDVALPRHKKAIFVHGCFWHGHKCSRGDRVPRTNRSYWQSKIARNIARDARASRSLRAHGWRFLIVWECQTRDMDRLARRVQKFVASRST